MFAVHDVAVPGTECAARVYRPTEAARGVVLFLHGGGWVFGDLETHDRACRRMAADSDTTVMALDYRRAPEHPWPAAVDDTIEALRWISTRPSVLGAIDNVVIAGDSAGGTIAALACLRARVEAPDASPACQVLVYANTDLAWSGGSMIDKGHGYGLDAADIDWFNSQWVPVRDMFADPRVSPLREPDLSGAPSAIIVTCEHDPLRDQGEAYASRLRAAGVPTTLRRERGMVHNFLLWDLASPACAAAGGRVAQDLRTAVSTRGESDRVGEESGAAELRQL